MIQVTWRGTPGVGDFMMALNACHQHAFTCNDKIELTMHWEHDENYIHHFEDPETIIERMDYIHNFYHRKDDVEVKHVFESKDRYCDWSWKDDIKVIDGMPTILHPKELGRADDMVSKTRYWFSDGKYVDGEEGIGKPEGNAPHNHWLFRKDAFRDTDKHKVVVWTPVSNAENPRWWKRKLTPNDWRVIIHKLRRQGMNVIELDYRTPVREAMYHISNCRLIVCYDGMWHYLGANFAKPMIVVSKEGVTKYHTPHCVRVCPDTQEEENIWWWLDRPETLFGHPKKKAVEYERSLRHIYEIPKTTGN